MDRIREVLSRTSDNDMKAVLTSPGNDATLHLQTPFMRAAARHVTLVSSKIHHWETCATPFGQTQWWRSVVE